MKIQKNIPYIIIALSGLFFFPFLGGVHLFDWDEINFAEISREMIILQDYLRVHIDFQPFFQKPPLFFWFQVLAMKIFGIGAYAARFPNAVFGILTLLMVYKVGNRIVGRDFGWIWSMTYFGSILPFLYFKSGIIDPVFNFFIFTALVYLFAAAQYPKKFQSLTWAGILTGLAILSKGPVALIIIGLVVVIYWFFEKFRWFISFKGLLYYLFMALLVTSLWFGAETLKNGPEFMLEFTKYQYKLFSTPDAGHKGFLGYHFVVLLIGCFPASLFAIQQLTKRSKGKDLTETETFARWNKILFWVVLILFSIVQSKIVHYSSLNYFPITFLASLSIYQYWKFHSSPTWKTTLPLLLVGMLYVAVIIALPFVLADPSWLIAQFKDPFAQANLQADVIWTGIEIVPGLLLLALLIFFLLSKQSFVKRTVVLFTGTAVFTFSTIIFFIGKIESYSQGAAIEFYQNLATKEAYVAPVGYKTYAHLFYTDKKPLSNPTFYSIDSLLYGHPDRSVYILTKTFKESALPPEFKVQERKNGFSLLLKDSSKRTQ